jgi:hypothetical protein
MRFSALVKKDGTLDWESQGMRFRWLSWCESNHGKPVVLEHKKGKRSLQANSLYWVWLTIVAADTGNSEDDLHRLFKGRFLTPKIITIGGKEYKLARSTTELTTSEFADYLTKVAAEIAQLGIILPTKWDADRVSINAL